jgi:predicted DNA-binding protein YlxM (UPF0122 family)
MAEVDFEKRVRFGNLYDIYGSLLTEKQQDIMRQYFCEDMSLGEIAEAVGTSRQAVYDLLKRVEVTLENYEEKLHVLKKSEEQQFKIRGAIKLLENYLADTSPEMRLKEVDRILHSIENESR